MNRELVKKYFNEYNECYGNTDIVSYIDAFLKFGISSQYFDKVENKVYRIMSIDYDSDKVNFIEICLSDIKVNKGNICSINDFISEIIEDKNGNYRFQQLETASSNFEYKQNLKEYNWED